MAKYRRKSTEVEAEQFNPPADVKHGDEYRLLGLPWQIRVDGRGPYLMLNTLRDVVTVAAENWVIRADDRYFTMAPAQFEATFEAVS